MASSLPNNVSVRTVDITPKNEKPKLPPVAENFYDDSLGAPINDTDDSCENVSNECAAKLVVHNELKNEHFEKYHEACVKVIAGNGEIRIQGSSILFQIREASQIMLVTASHVIRNKDNVTIVLELNYKATAVETTFTAMEHTIELQSPESEINEVADIAALLLSGNDSEYILKTTREFPAPSLCLDDRSSEKFMCIHYNGGDYKKVSTGEREGITEGSTPLQTRVHLKGGEGASGAPVFNFRGKVVAILRSHDKQYPEIRYCTSINLNDPNHLYNALPNLFESLEGEIFEQKLTCNLKKVSAKSGDAGIEAAELLTVFQCLGVGGKYEATRRHSRAKKIHSDHFPPYDALKTASEMKGGFCPNVKDFFRTHSSKNSQRYYLPAITIPKVIHTKHATSRSKTFRQLQAEDIAAGKVFDAIKVHFHDYETKGLFKRCNYNCSDDTFQKLMAKYRNGFANALEEHKQLGFIKDEDVERLEEVISDLTKKNETDGMILKPEDIIKLNSDGDLETDIEDLVRGAGDLDV